MRRALIRVGGLAAAAMAAVVAPGPVRPEPAVEVVATGVPRPLQLAVDGRTLVVLSPGFAGDAAGEIYRMALDAGPPVDLAREPRLRIPFAAGRPAALGSLALHPPSGALFLGEENGRRLWRLGSDGQLGLYATGLRRLAGGSTVAFDARGRLLVVDYADPRVSPPEERLPGFETFREEDYRGPLLFRLEVDPEIPLPRRLDRLAPLFPRGWGGPAGGALLPHLIAVAPLPDGDPLLLSSAGDLYRPASDGRLTSVTQLPRGQYLRINMAAAPDGTLYVSGGFWVARLFRVSPDGAVSVLASNLADPQGLALDDRGYLYLAESAFHRILRLRAR